jgi:hypothetical protein
VFERGSVSTSEEGTAPLSPTRVQAHLRTTIRYVLTQMKVEQTLPVPRHTKKLWWKSVEPQELAVMTALAPVTL